MEKIYKSIRVIYNKLKDIRLTLVLIVIFTGYSSNIFGGEKPKTNPQKKNIVEMKEKVQENLNTMPLAIQQNLGQLPSKEVLYYTSLAGHNIRFLKDGISFGRTRQIEENEDEKVSEVMERKEHLVWNLKFLGANQNCLPKPRIESKTKYNYFLGNLSLSDVTSFQEMWYNEIYDGIDLRYYSASNNKIEYDFIIQPKVDFNKIKLKYDGVKFLSIDSLGSLNIHTPWGTIIENHPVSYQIIKGRRVSVDVKFKLIDSTTYTFSVDKSTYNVNYELVIDPINLTWGTFVGSVGGSNKNYAFAMDLNAFNEVYVTGLVESGTMPVSVGAWQTVRNSGTPGLYNNYANLGNSIFYNDAECDASVYKLSRNGDSLLWCTYLGGTNFDVGTGIEVSSDTNNVYVTGITQSSNFPTTVAGVNSAIASSYDNSIGSAGVPDAFVVVFNSTGSKLRWSTYLGGNGHDEGYDLALDDSNNVYLTGGAASTDFPIVPSGNTNGSRGWMDVYVTKFNKFGQLKYSKVIGGASGGTSITANSNNRYECGFGIALKPNRSAIVCGTARNGFPYIDSTIFSKGNYTRVAQQGFVLGVPTSGSGALLFNTRISGFNANDTRIDYTLESTQSMFPGTYCYDLIVDDSNNIYITGATTSDSLTTSSGAYQTSRVAGFDGFVMKLDSNATSLKYSTYIGGNQQDFLFGIDLDCRHNPFVTGKTAGGTSNTYPTTSNAFQATYGGSFGDLIYSGFTNNGSKLAISSFLGGNDYDYGFGQIKSDGTNTYLTGTTHSGGSSPGNFPSTAGSYRSTHPNDGLDASFVVKLTFGVEALPSDTFFCALSTTTSIQLRGTDPSPYVSFWKQIQGPVVATMSDTNDFLCTASNMVPGYYKFQYLAFDPCRGDTSKDTAEIFIQNCDNDFDGLTNADDIDDDDDGIPDWVESCGSGATSFSCLPSSQNPSGDADGDNIPNYQDANWCTLNSRGVCSSLDKDGDGIINQFDRDSDNDGIPDIIEAGGVDINGDGKIDSNLVSRNDADGDGLFDKYDANCNNVVNSGRATTVTATSGTITNSANAVDADTTTFAVLNSNSSYIEIQFPQPIQKGVTITIKMQRDGGTNGTVDVSQYDSLINAYNSISTYTTTATATLFNYTFTSTCRKIRIQRTNANASRVLIARYSYTPCSGVIGTSLATPLDMDGDGVVNYLDLDSDNDGIPDLVEVGGADDNNDGYVDDYNPSTQFFSRSDADADGYSQVYDADTTNAYTLTFNNAQTVSGGLVTKGPLVRTGSDANNDGRPDSYVNGDPDGDVRLNCYDLDSDNDGIVDLVEVGGTDSNRDGKVDSFTDSDADGWNNAQDGFGTGAGNTPLIIPSIDTNNDGYSDGTNRWSNDNTDADKFANFIDIDSDGDGITDNTEAQATASYVAPGTTDANNDGLLDAYGTTSGSMGLVPVNTDSADDPDYLDLDTDNDSWSDAIEGHDTNGDNIADNGSLANNGIPTGLDIDFDGLDDGYDNNTALFSATNTGLQPTSHPNIDLSNTSERDWREKVYSISGTVFDDRGGLTDGVVNGTGIDAPSTRTTYVYLVDSASGLIKRKDTLNSGNGTYSFTNLNRDTTYFVVVSTTNSLVGAAGPISVNLPANWVSTGENFGVNNVSGTGNETGISDSRIKVKVNVLDVTGVNFGIDQRPLGTDKTAASQVNPGGTTTVQTPSLSATDLEDGAKGTGSWFIISSIPGNGTLKYNNVTLVAGDTIKNYDSTLLRVDPTFQGGGTIVFTFTSLDSAKIADSIPNTITMPFTGVTISGTVFDDRGGMTDNVVNGTGIDAPSSTTTYVYLVSVSTGNIVGKDTLNSANGTYTFSGQADGNTAYTVRVSTQNLNIGASAPSSANLPTGWVSTGENFGSNNSAGSGNESGTANSQIAVTTTTSNVTGVNFGIDQRPLGTDKTAASQVNPGGTTTVQTPSLSATDLEDGAKGTGSWFIISSIPGNGTLKYNNVTLVAGDTIKNYDSTLLRVDPTFQGGGTIVFTFTSLDSAKIADSIPNTITMPFTGVTISGTVFDDRGGMTDNVVNGTGIDAPSSTTTYVYLVSVSIGNIVGKDTLNSANGTYTFSGQADGNTAYTVRVSTQNLNIGASAPSSANLPTGWVSTGENFGSNNSAGSGNESGTANSQIAVTTTTSNVTGVNFGIDQRPVGTDKTAASQVNPGGTNFVQVPSLSANDLEDGSKGQGATFVINTIPVNGNLYYNYSLVSVGDTISNYDSTLLIVDPTFNGSGTVTFTFTAIDSARIADSLPNTINIPFTSISISGTVFNDRGGLRDGVINGTGLGNPSSTQLYANLIDSASGLVTAVVSVNIFNGTYIFNGLNGGYGYQLIISTTQGTIGNAPPSVTLPLGWVNVGESFGTNNASGSGNESGTSNGIIDIHTLGSNVTTVNFGLDRRPVPTSKTAASQINPGKTNTVQTPSLAGTDGEDGAKGQGSTFLITAIPNNAFLYYNNVALTAGDTIKNYDSTLLRLDPIFNGSGTSSFNFKTIDSAGVVSTSTATIDMPFTGLTISGVVYDDRGGLTDGTINGSPISNPALTQLYAHLIDSATGNVLDVTPIVTPTGVYSFNTGISANSGYRIVLSTTQGTIGNAAPSVTLPTNWVHTGEQYGTNNYAGTGVESGTPNGDVSVSTGLSNSVTVNFGIEQRPTGIDKTAPSQVNPGGIVAVQTPSLSGTDPEDGTKGTGSWFIINTLPTKGILYYNNVAITAGDTIKNYDSTKLTVDPTFNGSGTITFTFTSLDSAKIGDASPNTITMPFTSLTIGGTVFDDRGGLTDNTINGTGLGNPSTTQLYANLVDSATGVVRNVVAVTAGTGVYTISDSVNANTGYQIIISTTQGTIGSSAPSASLPTNWVNVGEQYGINNASGTGIESGTPNGIIRAHTISSNISNVNIGIDQLPDGADKTAASQVNPGGTVKVQTPSLGGTDLEDGTKGQGSAFIISSLPVNGTLYYNNVALASGDTIRNFDSTLLKVDPTFSGAGTVTFTYTTLDSALKADLTPNTITMPFTGINISGTLYNDASGLTNGVVDGTPTDTASSNTLYAYLVNGSGTIVGKDTLNSGNGTYQFNNIDGNTAYTVRVSTTNLSIGASGPSSANLPSGWASVGEAYGSNNNAGSGNESGTPNTQIAVTTIATDVTGVNFGIERTSLAYNKTYSGINPNLFNVPSGNSNYPYVMSLSNASGTSNTSVVGSNSTVMPGKVSGSDPEDGNYSGTSGSNGLRTLVLTILPDSTNDVMVYNGTVLKPGDNTNPYWNATNSRYEIPSFNANLLEIYIRKNGHTNTSFDYAWLDSAGVIGTSATYSVSGYGPLPVSLLNNQAQWKEKDGQVTWITASEINTDRFEIERSFDGQVFEKIGEVSAQGNSNTIKSYEYTDKGVKENVASKVYYRIRMVDKDETYTYSSVMELTQEKTTQVAISVYPNPSMNETTIAIEQDKQESYQISIIDITGKEVFKGTTNSTSKQTILDIQSLSAGVYQIIITTNNNRFIKQLVKVNK